MSNSTRAVTFRLSYKPFWHHVKAILSRPKEILLIFGGVLGLLWTIFELSIQFLDISPHGWSLYLTLFAISLLIALVIRVVRYVNACPPGFEGTPRNARRKAHLQLPKWEFELAKVLLAPRLGPIDRECKELMDGNVFVFAEKPRNETEYIEWLACRKENLLRMANVAELLLVERFPKALQSTADHAADPEAILYVVESIERFYRDTIDFQRAAFRVVPPAAFEKVHSLQNRFVEPIQRAVVQLFRFLRDATAVDPREGWELQFEFDIGEVPNLAEFEAELDRLQERLLKGDDKSL